MNIVTRGIKKMIFVYFKNNKIKIKKLKLISLH